MLVYGVTSPTTALWIHNYHFNSYSDFWDSIKTYSIFNSTMLKNTFVSGIVSVFYSLGTQPLQIWSQNPNSGMKPFFVASLKYLRFLTIIMQENGSISFTVDEILHSNVLNMTCSPENLSVTSIQCPGANLSPNSLGIGLPFITFQLRNVRSQYKEAIEARYQRF